MTRVEHDTIRQRHGVDIPQTGTDMCPALTVLGRCSVYADRPLLCRIWGVVESLPCQWGCRPARVLTDAEGYGLLARAADVDGDRAAAARFRQGAA
jgi:Fe-S-cluster containining protein